MAVVEEGKLRKAIYVSEFYMEGILFTCHVICHSLQETEMTKEQLIHSQSPEKGEAMPVHC